MTGGERSLRPLRVGGLPVALGALKALEDGGGLPLRVYEPRGARGALGVDLGAGWRLAGSLDLLEREIGPPDLELRPFQVRSLALRRSAARRGARARPASLRGSATESRRRPPG